MLAPIVIFAYNRPEHLKRCLDSLQSNFEFDKRLVFRFGDTEENVKNKLYERDKVLEFEKKLSYEEQ